MKITTSFIIFLFGVSFGYLIGHREDDKVLYYQKSSDSPLERSAKHYNDTIIIDTVYLNSVRDTAYKTVEYFTVNLSHDRL